MEFDGHNISIDAWVSNAAGKAFLDDVQRRAVNLVPKRAQNLRSLKADVLDEILRKHYKLPKLPQSKE